MAKSKTIYQSPGTWAKGHCFYHCRLKILVQAGIGKWGKTNSKHFWRVVKGILKARKAAYWSLVFYKVLDFSVYMRASQLGAIMDKNYYMMYESTHKWSLGKEVLEREFWHMKWYKKHCLVWLFGELYTGMWHLWEKFCEAGQVPWAYSRLVTYSLGSALLSSRKFRSQQLLCNQGTKRVTRADYKRLELSERPELLFSCDCNM